MNIDDLLIKKEFQVRELLRVNQIRGKGLEGIKEGYNRLGNTFMLKVIDTLKDESNNFSNYPYMVDGVEVDVPETSEPSKSGWDIWSNILKTIGETGKTIADVKNNITGGSPAPATVQPYVVGSASANSTILYLAGAAVLVIVLILIFKKK